MFFLFGGLKKAGKVTQNTYGATRRLQVETVLTRVACRGITQLLLNVSHHITCLRVKEPNLNQGPVNNRKAHRVF